MNEPPARVEVLGQFEHLCEGVVVCKASNKMAPLINRPVFLADKKKVGVVDEVFGQLNSFVSSNARFSRGSPSNRIKGSISKVSKPD